MKMELPPRLFSPYLSSAPLGYSLVASRRAGDGSIFTAA